MTPDLVTGLGLGIIASIIASEILNFSWVAAKKLVKRAANRLPEPYRERFEEEWLSYLESMRSYPKIWLLYQAITIYFKAAPAINTEVSPKSERSKSSYFLTPTIDILDDLLKSRLFFPVLLALVLISTLSYLSYGGGHLLPERFNPLFIGRLALVFTYLWIAGALFKSKERPPEAEGA